MSEGGLVVLLAEDDDANRKMVATMLRKEGHRVVECMEGLAAQDLLMRWPQPLDLAILDVCMPGMDGLAICAALRNSGPGRALPVVMVSALGNRSNIAEGLAAGADAYLVKPFALRDLRAAMARARTLRSTT